MRTVHVEVTQEDIDRGKPAIADQCALALACSRAGLGNVYISGGRVYPPGNQPEIAMLPILAARFYRAFDRGEAVEPFSFDLELP